MLLVVFQAGIALEDVEHLAVGADVVPVDDGVGAGFGEIDRRVDKRDGVLAVFALKVCPVIGGVAG